LTVPWRDNPIELSLQSCYGRPPSHATTHRPNFFTHETFNSKMPRFWKRPLCIEFALSRASDGCIDRYSLTRELVKSSTCLLSMATKQCLASILRLRAPSRILHREEIFQPEIFVSGLPTVLIFLILKLVEWILEPRIAVRSVYLKFVLFRIAPFCPNACFRIVCRRHNFFELFAIMPIIGLFN
jgi:hypothetical protein